MYNYGLGQSWTEEALPEQFPAAGESGGGTADEASMEILAGPVPDAPAGSIEPGFLDRLKLIKPAGWIALAAGAAAGYHFGRGKNRPLTAALGAAVAWYGGRSLGL